MAKQQAYTVPAKGSVAFIQKGLGTPAKITGITGSATNESTGESQVKIATSLKASAGDVVFIEGVSGLGGFYPVASVETKEDKASTLVLCPEIYIDDLPKASADATVALVQFYETAFCDVKGYQYGGPSKKEVDVGTVCPERPTTEPGDMEFESLTLNVWRVPDDTLQIDLKRKFQQDTKFAIKIRYPQKRGTSYFAGWLQKAPGFSGNAGDKLESSIEIKMTQIDYFLPAGN